MFIIYNVRAKKKAVVLATCGPKQVGAAVPQFGGDVDKCNQLFSSNANVRELFSQYMLPLVNHVIEAPDAALAEAEAAAAGADPAPAEGEAAPAEFYMKSQEPEVDDGGESDAAPPVAVAPHPSTIHHFVNCETQVEGWRFVLKPNLNEGQKYNSVSECEYGTRMEMFGAHCSIDTTGGSFRGEIVEEAPVEEAPAE